MADFTFEIPTFGRRSKIGLGAGDILATDVRAMQKRLKEIDKNLRKQLLREAKAPAIPIQRAVKAAIPSSSPLGTSRPSVNGRMVWGGPTARGTRVAANTTKIQFRTAGSKQTDVTSLVAVKVTSPLTIISDMAGSSKNFMNAGYKGSGVTKEYNVTRNGVTFKRKHTVAGQGYGMLKKLGGKASRFIWPAAESKIPQARMEIEKVLEKFTKISKGQF